MIHQIFNEIFIKFTMVDMPSNRIKQFYSNNTVDE